MVIYYANSHNETPHKFTDFEENLIVEALQSNMDAVLSQIYANPELTNMTDSARREYLNKKIILVGHYQNLLRKIRNSIEIKDDKRNEELKA